MSSFDYVTGIREIKDHKHNDNRFVVNKMLYENNNITEEE